MRKRRGRLLRAAIAGGGGKKSFRDRSGPAVFLFFFFFFSAEIVIHKSASEAPGQTEGARGEQGGGSDDKWCGGGSGGGCLIDQATSSFQQRDSRQEPAWTVLLPIATPVVAQTRNSESPAGKDPAKESPERGRRRAPFPLWPPSADRKPSAGAREEEPPLASARFSPGSLHAVREEERGRAKERSTKSQRAVYVPATKKATFFCSSK